MTSSDALIQVSRFIVISKYRTNFRLVNFKFDPKRNFRNMLELAHAGDHHGDSSLHVVDFAAVGRKNRTDVFKFEVQ